MLNNRKKFIIYPRFQWVLILAQLGCGLLVMGAIMLSVHFAFENLIADGMAAGIPGDNPYFSILQYQKSKVLLYVAIVCGLGFLVTMALMILISHRVAGPIVRLRNYFENYSDNKDHPVQFRKGDFFSDLPGSINKALGKTKE